MLTTTLIYAGLVPLVVAALAASIVGWLGCSPAARWPAGVALGVVAGQLVANRHAGLWAAVGTLVHPTEPVQWLPILVLLAWGISLLLNAGSRLALPLAALFSLAVPLRLLGGIARISQEWSFIEKLACLALLAAAIGFPWLLLATRSDEEPGFSRPLFVTIVAVGTAVAVTLAGVFSYGELAGALAAAATGAALACFSAAAGSARAKPPSAMRGHTGAAGPIACVLVSLIVLCHFYSELSVSSAVLLLVSLAAAAAPLPKPLANHPAWLNLSSRALLCLTPLAIALILVVGSMEPEAGSQSPYSQLPPARSELLAPRSQHIFPAINAAVSADSIRTLAIFDAFGDNYVDEKGDWSNYLRLARTQCRCR